MILHRYLRVDSTQRVAKRLAEAGSPHGTVVLAEEQTAGRGRLDRRWISAPGLNLTFSLVLRPPAVDPLVTLGAAAGLAEALDLRVKWPNDLVDGDGRKVGGVLGEADGWIVLGVGLNVNQREFPGLPDATSLALLRGDQDRDAVLDLAVRAILAWCSHPGRLDLWRQRSHTLGKRVKIGDHEGVATGLRDDGALLVAGRAITTGEVS